MRRILVVDDEESMRYFLVRSLRRAGYEVAAASTGEEGLALAAAGPFDLALLDLRLPGISGLEVLEAWRGRRPALPVIVMTGFGTVDRALEAMRRGAADFVTKPFKVAEILAKVDEALGHCGPGAGGAPPAPAPVRGALPRPLSAFLLEAAKERGLAPEEAAGDLCLREASRLFESLYFAELLERTGGNVSLAARIAGVSRPSVHRRIRELKLDVGGFRASPRGEPDVTGT
jgi:DNA-binding NtrC family response regulator